MFMLHSRFLKSGQNIGNKLCIFSGLVVGKKVFLLTPLQSLSFSITNELTHLTIVKNVSFQHSKFKKNLAQLNEDTTIPV